MTSDTKLKTNDFEVHPVGTFKLLERYKDELKRYKDAYDSWESDFNDLLESSRLERNDNDKYVEVLTQIRDGGTFPADRAGRVLEETKKQRSH